MPLLAPYWKLGLDLISLPGREKMDQLAGGQCLPVSGIPSAVSLSLAWQEAEHKEFR